MFSYNDKENESTSLPSSSSTVVKYEKSSCVFCNEWFDSHIFTEHLIHCGQVLDQCPNSCSAFLPRIRMRAHLKECPRGDNAERFVEHIPMDPKRVSMLEQDIISLRSVLNEEIRQRLHLITDVGSLRKQNQIFNEKMQQMEDTLQAVKTNFHEGDKTDFEQCENNFRYCYDQSQSNKSDLHNEIVELQNHIDKISLEVCQHQNHLNDNILQLEETMLNKEKLNSEKFLQTQEFMEQISNDLKTKDNFMTKVMTLDFEMKSMKNVVYETEERCEKIETLVSGLDRTLHHTMQTITDIEQHLAMQQRLNGLQNTRGNLVWRIKEYSKKLEESKQYDTVLHSSMFSNRPFGYALRLDIHLNGKGTWKGRNMIACLNVIAGEFDPLLTWPCRLKADVIVRDQMIGNTSVPQDYIKTISVRKKSDAFIENNQYFYIPHKMINSRNYLRNDCIFIEVKVLKS